MGVQGLNKEIGNNLRPMYGEWRLDREVYRNLNTNQRVKKNENGTLNLIIDANAYFYYLSGMINWFIYDNKDLLDLMKKHLHYLLSIKNLKDLIFVFDGINPTLKAETEEERRQNKISSMNEFFNEVTTPGGNWLNQVNNPRTLSPSPLVQMIFIQFLVDISKIYKNIRTEFCIFEADAYIAELSKRYNGYAISNDSDFYIYNTPGYINISSLEFPKDANDGNFVIKYKLYTRDMILRYFSLTDDTLPIFATLCGNDYLKIKSYQRLRDFFKYYSRNNRARPSTQSISYFIYKNIANFVLDMDSYSLSRLTRSYINHEGITLRQTSIIERICEKIPQEFDPKLNRDFREILIKSVQQYNNTNNNINGINGRDFEISNDILNSFNSGNYFHRILNVIVKNQFECSYYFEDYSKESSWNITSNIRKSMYGLIKSRNNSINNNKGIIEEYSRNGVNISFNEVRPTFDYTYDDSSVERNYKQYLKIFDSNIEIVKKLPYYLIPVVASLRYLLKDKIEKKLFAYAEDDETYRHLPNASNYPVSYSQSKLNYYELEALIASSIAALTFTYLNKSSPYLKDNHEDTQEYLINSLSHLSLNSTSTSFSSTSISSSNLTIENNIQINDQKIHQTPPFNNIYTAMTFNGNESGRYLILKNNRHLEALQNRSSSFKNAIHIYAEFKNTLIVNSYILQVLKLTENLTSFSSFYSMYCYIWEGAYYNMVDLFRRSTNNRAKITSIFKYLFNGRNMENTDNYMRKLGQIYKEMLKAIVSQ
jgi:hypothetical protein